MTSRNLILALANEEGHAARREGKRKVDNPHEYQSNEWWAWRTGWICEDEDQKVKT
jgi:hypothetical protein